MMKRFSKSSMQGVTLLEIMLVLAIAAMIIVMSIRYYQSATSSQQANTVLEQIQAITAAADNLAQATGSYKAANVSTASIQALVPQNSMTAPWGGAITIGTVNDSSYQVQIVGTPTAVCPLLLSRLNANNHFAMAAGCASYTYTANP